jgi:hypothetical protein
MWTSWASQTVDPLPLSIPSKLSGGDFVLVRKVPRVENYDDNSRRVFGLPILKIFSTSGLLIMLVFIEAVMTLRLLPIFL